MVDAACAKLGYWQWDGLEVADQLTVCRTCPVLRECREYARVAEKGQEPYGVLGGLTGPQRRKHQGRRRRGGTCKRGHDLTLPESKTKDGGCVICHRAKQREQHQQKRRAA